MVADVTSVSVSIWYDVISSSTDSLYFVINSFASIGGAKATTMAVFSRGVNLIIVGGPGTSSNVRKAIGELEGPDPISFVMVTTVE